MDTQNLLFINLGLTIVTLIGLICVIVYMVINCKSKDKFLYKEDLTIPSISVPPTGFENTLITDIDGNMNTFSLKKFADDITASIKVVNDELQKQIDKKSAEIDYLTAVTLKKDTKFRLKLLGTKFGPEGGQSNNLKDGGYIVAVNAGGKVQVEWRKPGDHDDWQLLFQAEETPKNW